MESTCRQIAVDSQRELMSYVHADIWETIESMTPRHVASLHVLVLPYGSSGCLKVRL